MRKFTVSLLLTAVAIPAMAAAQDESGHRQRDKSEQSDNRSAREARAERAQQNEQRQQQVQAQRQAQMQQMQGDRQAQIQQMQAARQAQMQQMQQQQLQRQAQQQQFDPARQGRDRGRSFDGQRDADGRTREEQIQQYRADMAARRAQSAAEQATPGGLVERQGRYRSVPNVNPVFAGRPAPENRDARYANRDRRDDRHWSASNWRSDNRYDWRRYRDQHRSIFRIGAYFDPFGYSYNRFSIGSYLYPDYYQSNYWISDPWQYRLPPAYGPYRWIRYHDDALMIDTWTGEVVDVIYGFFW